MLFVEKEQRGIHTYLQNIYLPMDIKKIINKNL